MKLIHEQYRIYSIDECGKIVAEITFPQTEPGVFTIEHTFVDSSLRGHVETVALLSRRKDEPKIQAAMTCKTE